MFPELLASQGFHLEHLVPFHRLIEILPKALERVLLDAASREFGAALLALRLVVLANETLVIIGSPASLPRRGSGT